MRLPDGTSAMWMPYGEASGIDMVLVSPLGSARDVLAAREAALCGCLRCNGGVLLPPMLLCTRHPGEAPGTDRLGIDPLLGRDWGRHCSSLAWSEAWRSFNLLDTHMNKDMSRGYHLISQAGWNRCNLLYSAPSGSLSCTLDYQADHGKGLSISAHAARLFWSAPPTATGTRCRS